MPERTTFGDFVLHERLAVGGMGELYLATRTDRRAPPVALKILLREFRDTPEWIAMFRDEARIGMRLSHRNIVGVHEVGSVGSIPYIVLEYVHGENLRAVLRAMLMAGDRIPPALAVNIAIDVLLGLEHAHRAKDENGRPLNLVHRDLSPDNILLSYEGEVKILDFGIAKAEGRSTHTQIGVVKGKPQYMSPEQANERAVDARSDLFALGLVLLELLTGEKRFHHDDHIMQFVEAKTWKAYAPSEKVKGLPVELDAVLLKGLQPEPERRWQTADEFASALTRLARSGLLARPPQTLPVFLHRLFPDRVEKRFDADEITVLRERPAEPEDLDLPPRWATDETNAAVNLATLHGGVTDEPTNTATMERSVAVAAAAASPVVRRPGPIGAIEPVLPVRPDLDPITRESPRSRAEPTPAPRVKTSALRRNSARSSIWIQPRDPSAAEPAPAEETPPVFRRRNVVGALLVLVPLAIAGTSAAVLFARRNAAEVSPAPAPTPTRTPRPAPTRRRRTTRKPSPTKTPRK